MKIGKSRKGISVFQWKYMLELLKEIRMFGCKPADTLMDPNIKLRSKLNSTLVDKKRYQYLVDKLIYLSVPDHILSLQSMW